MTSLIIGGGKMAYGIASCLQQAGRNVTVAIRNEDTVMYSNANRKVILDSYGSVYSDLYLDLCPINKHPIHLTSFNSLKSIERIKDIWISIPNSCISKILNDSLLINQVLINNLINNDSNIYVCSRGLSITGMSSIEHVANFFGSKGLKPNLCFISGAFSPSGMLRYPPLNNRFLYYGTTKSISNNHLIQSLSLISSHYNICQSKSISINSAHISSIISALGLIFSWLSGHLSSHYDLHDIEDIRGLLYSTSLEISYSILSIFINDKENIYSLYNIISTQMSYSIYNTTSPEFQFGQSQYFIDEWNDEQRPNISTDSDTYYSFQTVHQQALADTIHGFKLILNKVNGNEIYKNTSEFIEQLYKVVYCQRRGHEMSENILNWKQGGSYWMYKDPPLTPAYITDEKVSNALQQGLPVEDILREELKRRSLTNNTIKYPPNPFI